jgi:hypothetical protein
VRGAFVIEEIFISHIDRGQSMTNEEDWYDRQARGYGKFLRRIGISSDSDYDRFVQAHKSYLKHKDAFGKMVRNRKNRDY